MQRQRLQNVAALPPEAGGNTYVGCIPILAAPPSKCSGSAFTMWQQCLQTAVAMSLQHPDTAALFGVYNSTAFRMQQMHTYIHVCIHPSIHTYMDTYIHT
uniref:Uncharacterized protein n=1 Tax=Eutreptiella gymnastica TaxID=73025 RepID=A0A7S4G995_9EUGL